MGSEFRSRFRSLLAPTRSAMLNQSYRNRGWKSSGAATIRVVAGEPNRIRTWRNCGGDETATSGRFELGAKAVSKLVMARDFWFQTLESQALTSLPFVHRRPPESSRFCSSRGDIRETMIKLSRWPPWRPLEWPARHDRGGRDGPISGNAHRRDTKCSLSLVKQGQARGIVLATAHSLNKILICAIQQGWPPQSA